MKLFLSIFLLLSTIGITYAGERLNNDELKSFYSDKTLSGKHHKLGTGKTYYGQDGSVHSMSDKGKERIGKWWIDEKSNKRCIRWDHKNKDFCHYTERNDDGTYTLIHGKNGKELVQIKSSQDGNHLK